MNSFSLIAVIAIGAINVAGWVYTRVYAMGKLNGKIEQLEATSERHDKVLSDGIAKELSELKAEVAGLTGTLNTYIDLTKDKHG